MRIGSASLKNLPGDRLDLVHEAAVEPHPVHHRQSLGAAQADIVFAVGRRAVHDAGAVLDGHEVGRPHLADGTVGGEVVEQARVAHSLEVGTLHALADGVLGVPQHRAEQGFGEDQGLSARAHEGVVDIGMHREGEVRGQRPRRGGPHQERGALFALDREADIDRWILDLLVAERDLVRRKRGTDTRVVGHDLVALVDESLVPDLAQQPPHRLDEGVVEGVVGVAHVHPEAHAFGHPLPVADVAHHGLAAPAGELRHPHLAFDLGLVEDPELLLDLVLDRQAVGVPSGLARAVVALHVLEAGEDVLEGAGEDVVDPRPPVGGGRPLVPAVERPALARTLRLVEHVVLAPQGEHLLLELHAVVPARHVREARRPSRLSFHRRASPKRQRPGNQCGTSAHGRSHCIESRGDGSTARCAAEVAVPPGFTRASRHGPRAVTACPPKAGAR